jgi:8-oxo-dGTP pyrophosphatase MutT (NUDIX family)
MISTTGPKNLNVIQSRAIVFNSKNELLLVSKNGVRWSLPGGTVNKHHPLDKLAVDEVYEEVGLNVKMDSLAYYLQEKWDVTNGFWNFDEHIEYPFTAYCLVFAYHCSIIDSEIIDENWKDLDHDVIKFKKFVNENEFLEIQSGKDNKSLAQDELIGLNFEKIKNLKNQHLFR